MIARKKSERETSSQSRRDKLGRSVSARRRSVDTRKCGNDCLAPPRLQQTARQQHHLPRNGIRVQEVGIPEVKAEDEQIRTASQRLRISHLQGLDFRRDSCTIRLTVPNLALHTYRRKKAERRVRALPPTARPSELHEDQTAVVEVASDLPTEGPGVDHDCQQCIRPNPQIPTWPGSTTDLR